MRCALVAVAFSACFAAAPAAQAGGLVPSLRLDTALVVDTTVMLVGTLPSVAAFAQSAALSAARDAARDATRDSAHDVVNARSQVRQLPSDYAWVERDTRAFWYSAGAGAVTSLASHVLIGVPTLVLSVGLIMGVTAGAAPAVGFAVGLALAIGIGGTYAFAESLLSALASTLVFNGLSELYEGDYVTALMAHFGGSLVSTAVTTVTFGGGVLLFHGMGALAEFTGSAGLTTVQVFSFLGAMPAVVIAGIALIAVPALVTAWALAVSASPRKGFEIDEEWLTPVARAREPRPDRDRSLGLEPARYAFALPLPIP